MDRFFEKSTSVLADRDVHLVGITSIFIASKFEDVFPIRMKNVYKKIAFEAFTEVQIKEKEIIILDTIDIASLYGTSAYEFVKTFFYDFLINNKNKIIDSNTLIYLKLLEHMSLYMIKLILHFENFSSYRMSMLAISSIIVAFDLWRSNYNEADNDQIEFIKSWILFLIEENGASKTELNDIYSVMIDAQKTYENYEYINGFLKKTHPLFPNLNDLKLGDKSVLYNPYI